jgi:hypothetical protein
MQGVSDRKPKPPRPIKHRYTFDGAMMAIYTAAVYGWGLGVYPLGRDYALFEQPAGLPVPTQLLWHAETAAFGAWTSGYHLINVALLYACMLCTYHLTRFILRGPAWLGSLAATMFMANPVHTESVLNLSGAADLLPCLFALAALAVYASPWARNTHSPRRTAVRGAAFVLFALAVFHYRENLGLVAVLFVYELCHGKRTAKHWAALAPYAALTAVELYLHLDVLRWSELDIAGMFAPLFFIVYPIGYLPETAALFHDTPWLGWIAAAAVIAVVALVYRKARRPAILFGLLGMACVRLFQGGHFIDPVHLIGGGQLLLACALFNVAAAALFLRIMEHPKWRQSVIAGTTLLCLILFAMQIHANRTWHEAGRLVQEWRQQASMSAKARAGGPLYVLPDYRYYQGAPICHTEALTHTTPFGPALPAVSVLPLHYDAPERMTVTVEQWSPNGATLRVTGKLPVQALPWPYTVRKEGDTIETAEAAVQCIHVEDNGFTLSIRPKNGAFTVPFSPENPH